MFTTKRPFLGYAAAPNTFGLARANGHAAGTPILHEGGAHCLTIGQTGSGKTNLMIANLLLWEGSAIVIDVRGDAMRATARWRREVLGQKVYVLEPFRAGGSPDRLDPLELVTLPGADADAEAQSITSVLAAPVASGRDPYWHLEGGNLLAGIMAYMMDPPKNETRSMNSVMELLFATECDQRLATMLDCFTTPGKSFWHQSFCSYLEIPDSSSAATRSCVLSMARTMLHPFRCRAVQSAMGPSTVDLGLLLEGKPVTLYLVLPIERLMSHAVVLGLWLEVLCQTLLRRTSFPELPTLLFVDECGQFGCVSTVLKMVAVYIRGQAVKLWSFFQDIGQIRTMFGTDFSTFVNSSSAITVLPGTGMAARETAGLLGVPEREIMGLPPDEQLVYEVGRETRSVKMARYWSDDLFRGRFDVPRRFSGKAAAPEPVVRPKPTRSRIIYHA